MIDLGLSKMALIGVIALVVIGPKDLPKVARMAGSLFGRARRYINEVKSEVSREIELDELRNLQKDVQDAAQEVEQSVAQGMSQTEDDLNSAWHGHDANSSVTSLPSDDAIAIKAKDFRRKKLARTSALPVWYKNQNGHRGRVMSGSARMARHRVKPQSAASFY
jgi:sec-independent protein translocase protein TatB